MRILFEMYHPGFLRNFEGPVRRLLDREHELVLAFERPARLGEDKLVAELCAAYGNLSTVSLKKPRRTAWGEVAEAVRTTGDYWRYLDPRYRTATALAARAAKKAPSAARRLGQTRLMRTKAAQGTASAALRAAEWALPPSQQIVELVDKVKPDLILLTPLVGLGSSQADVVKVARHRRIPCVLGVASWDNLTNKGVIRAAPDRVVVWNEAQREEAIQLHDIPRQWVHVCGAWTYDHWFTWQPACSRDEFMRTVGLDPARDYLLYVCSSPFIAPVETSFVRRWAKTLADSPHQAVRDIGLLVRPHPQNAEQWRDEDLSDIPNVVVWPRAGANPIDGGSRNDYFHSLHFSRGIVGINTSALIEAGIIGRPVFTVTDGEFAATQEGTLHFHHLTSVNGGLLHSAPTISRHADQLAAALAVSGGTVEKGQRFVEAFIRDPGDETTGTDRFVSAIEGMAGIEPGRVPVAGPALMRPVLGFWAWWVRARLHATSLVTPKQSERKRA